MNTQQTPRVSVVVAAYNAASTLRESVGSLQAQTLGDIEILVCEDCSADGTYALLKELAAGDDRIRVIRNDVNSGQALGRNRCFALARGSYIAIHDADDISRPDRLWKQAEFLDAHPQYAFVASLIDTVDDRKRILDRPDVLSGEIAPRHFLFGQPFIHPTTLFRAEALRRMGGYRVEEETRYRNEDYDLFMRMYGAGMKGYVYPERLYEYYEGVQALRRRKYRYRVAEARVRYRNFKVLRPHPLWPLYVVKPLVVGLFPQTFLNRVRMRFWRRHQEH